MLCPIDFFSNQVDFKRNWSGIAQKYEYLTPQLTLSPQPDLHGLYSVRSNLSVAEGLFVCDERIVIPSALQSEILEVIHHGHQGIT